MKTAQQILEEAWALLQKPGVWIQGDFARTAEGHYIETLNDKAACFCSIGALCKVADAEPWMMLYGPLGEGSKGGQQGRLTDS